MKNFPHTNIHIQITSKENTPCSIPREELDSKLMKGIESLKSGYFTVDEVDAELFKNFGI